MSIKYSGVFDSSLQAFISERLSKATKQWLQTWFIAANDVAVNIQFNEQLFSSLNIQAQTNFKANKTGITLCVQPEPMVEAMLCDALNIDKATLPILLKSLEKKPLAHLNEDLHFKLQCALDVPDNVEIKSAQVAAVIAVKASSWTLDIALDWQVLTHLLPKAEQQESMPVFSLKHAAKHHTVPVRVAMKSQPLSFVDVMSLKKGDVIMLKQAVEAPIPVEINHVSEVVQGFLVERDSSKAIIFSES
ncbi:hypothetical protein BB427_13910 [Pseudoalteromonas sp. BMB]|uniref:FliM/FliN family flagellar motor switch protein n=1 Tax=Pseudoalteromonas sp. BMB TaxID=1874619 RepID=UPI00083E2457|nr:FliM/FliN family flagellar motor C-terminal domain-containing protein [Pseudoalteromonas sp. BMB]ODB37088.1 hypothetical protein BB427_13910 [Pseudoalteromonas sp. BMB]